MDTLAERVADRFRSMFVEASDDDVDTMVVAGMGEPPMERRHYLPPEARDEKPLVPEGTDLEIYTWDGTVGPRKKPAFFGIAFQGKANKPLWHYAFGTQSNRIEEIRKTIESRKQTIERKRAEQAEKASFVHGLKVGDIMVCSWGYDQTNIDFYEVTDVRGKNVIVREIASEVIAGHGAPQETVMPVPHHFVGAPLTKRPGGTTGHPSIKVNSFSSAHLWDGKPEHQTGGAFGH